MHVFLIILNLNFFFLHRYVEIVRRSGLTSEADDKKIKKKGGNQINSKVCQWLQRTKAQW